MRRPIPFAIAVNLVASSMIFEAGHTTPAQDSRTATAIFVESPGPAMPAADPAPRTALAGEVAERARYLMGSPCRIVASHPEPGRAAALIENAFTEIDRWNSILSDWDAGSELSRLNASAARAPVACSEDLFAWLERTVEFVRETEGAFDPTAGALVDLYAIRSGGRWPSDPEIESARGRVGVSRVALDARARTVRFLSAGVRLDPGAIGKGTALDAAGRVLREGGADWALLDFGGQILAVGAGPSGEGFPVDLPLAGGGRGPEVIRLRDASASTSSNSERGVEVEGRLLGHIFDPRTLLPVGSRGTVTVVAPTAERADALDTAFFVMGAEQALKAALRLGVEARFVSGPDGDRAAAHATPGFARLLEPSALAPPTAAQAEPPTD